MANNASIRSLTNFVRFFTDNKTGATGELATDVYRPLTTLSYAVDYAIWGLNSFGYHLTNIILHSANAILVYMLLFLLSENFFIAFFGSLIFASHPVHTEVVAWISGRSSVLFLFFYLASLIFYIKFTRQKNKAFYYSSLFLFALSLFSKEMSITLPLIIILYDIYFPSNERWMRRIIRYIPYFALCIFYVALRITLIKRMGQFEGWGSPYFVFLTVSNAIADYIRLLLFPLKLCAVGYAIPIAASIKEPRVIYSLILLVMILLGLPFLFRRHRAMPFAVYLFFITLLPVLNIIPIKTLEAERFLYLPSIGFCLLISCMASMLGEKFNKPLMGKASMVIVLSCILIIGYSSKTIIRAREWKDESTISRKTLETYPNGAWAILASGINFMDRKNYTVAAELLKRGVAPCVCATHQAIRITLGKCYLRMERYEEAISQFREVLGIDPFSVMTRNFIGVAYANLKKYDEAEKHFTVALKKDPGFLEAHLNLGRLYEMKGDHGKAIKQYEKILEAANNLQNRAVLIIRIGDAYLKMGSGPEAKSHYQKALEIAGRESDLIKKLVEDRLKEL